MEDSREVASTNGGRVAGRLAPRMVIRGFSFHVLPLMNLIDVDDLIHERKAHTYIKTHRLAFNFDPADEPNFVLMLMVVHSFVCVGNNSKMDNSGLRKWNVMGDNSAV